MARLLTTVTLLLACAATALAAQRTGDLQSIGDFYYQHSIDPFTDADRSFIMSVDEERLASLGWKCMADGLNVVFTHQHWYGGDSSDRVYVRWRFDSHPASDTEYMHLFPSDQKSMWLPISKVASFTQQARAANVVVLRVTDPLDSETHTYTFSLNGLIRALTRLPCAR